MKRDDTDTDTSPVTEAVAWTRLPKGWVVTHIKIQDGSILYCEALSDIPEKSEEARQRIAVESAAKFAAAVGPRGLRS